MDVKSMQRYNTVKVSIGQISQHTLIIGSLYATLLPEEAREEH